MEFTKRNIALMIIFLLLCLVIVSLVFIFIWKLPFLEPDAFKYERYTEQEAQDKICKHYTELVARNLINKNFDWFYSKLPEEFLQKEGITKENIRTYFLKNNIYTFSNNVEAGKYTYYIKGDKTVYEVQFKINNRIQIINIIETAHNEFFISFDYQTYEEKTEKTLKGSLKGIEIEMNRTYKDKNVEIYDVSISNTLDQTVEFEFLDVTNIKLKDEQKNVYDLNTDVSSVIDEPLSKGSKIKKEMSFAIPSSVNAKYITFYEVKINGKEQKLEIELK